MVFLFILIEILNHEVPYEFWLWKYPAIPSLFSKQQSQVQETLKRNNGEMFANYTIRRKIHNESVLADKEDNDSQTLISREKN